VPRALLALLAALAVWSADAADLAFAIDVPAGRVKSVRLRNVPAGAAMAVNILTSGKLLVALVSEAQLKVPKPDASPLFRGVAERQLAFRITIPERGDYFLVLSNRGGAEPLSVRAEIRAVGGAPKPAPPPTAKKLERA